MHRNLFPNNGTCNHHNEDCLSNIDRKVPRGLRRAFSFKQGGKGALLPSVAGSGALQPCVGGLKQSITRVGNKHRLPAKSWSASSVAFYILPANLAADMWDYFSSLNIILLLETGKVTGEYSSFFFCFFFMLMQLDQKNLFFHPKL